LLNNPVTPVEITACIIVLTLRPSQIPTSLTQNYRAFDKPIYPELKCDFYG
jgi:hypothetical protein